MKKNEDFSSDWANMVQDKLDRILGKVHKGQLQREINEDDEIKLDLVGLWCLAWCKKRVIALFTFLFFLVSLIYFLSLQDVYQSEVLLSPAPDSSSKQVPSLVGQFGGLASLAGVDLGAGGGEVDYALEVLKSREFLFEFIERHGLYSKLLALKGWDARSGALHFDSSIYIDETDSWDPEFLNGRTKPSLQHSYENFVKKMKITQDTKTKFVKIEMQHYSPVLAREGLDLLVKDLNENLRLRALNDLKRNIEYLEGQLKKTSLTHMKKIFFELVEEQTKKMMFAEVREDYAFRIIDPAIVPENKTGPKRVLGIAISSAFGCLLSLVYIVTSHFVSLAFRLKKQ